MPKKHPLSKKKVTVNTSIAKGELKLIRSIIHDNGWQEAFKGGDIMWSGTAVTRD